MPKKELLRRIDHRDKTERVLGWDYAVAPGTGINVREVDGSPNVKNVKGVIVPNASLTDNGDGTVTITFPAATGGGVGEIVCSMFGTLVLGDLSTVVTNLTGDDAPYNKLKATCEPIAPEDGITVTVHITGMADEDLTIAEGAAASSVTTLSPAGTWEADDDIWLEITALTGSYTGTITVMLADDE